jgi:hypothetical protein
MKRVVTKVITLVRGRVGWEEFMCNLLINILLELKSPVADRIAALLGTMKLTGGFLLGRGYALE